MLIDELLEDATPEEIEDFYVEKMTELRELELRMWHTIGKCLSAKDEKFLKSTAKKLNKHSSELLTAVAFYVAYPEFEKFPFDKSTSWQAIKKILGTYEKRERKTLKEIVKKRLEENIARGMEGDDEAKIRAEEDEAILKNETTP